MMGQEAPKMPKHLVVAGQNGANVQVYDCVAKTTKSVPGYLRNIGIDNNGNVYILVSDERSGWGNYYVYKNYDTKNPYQSLVWNNAEGIYSSMAMKVKGNDVVVAGVQSLGFNDKGYQSRMFGYVNKKLVFRTDYERKSLKYDQFKGYVKISGSGVNTKVIGYGQENNSGNPQGDHLSCVYRVECVDYDDGKIYTGGWGEREYSETPVGYRTQYMVRRCPRVWENGSEYVDLPNKTGAVWNLYKPSSDDKNKVYYSGHLGSVARLWSGDGIIKDRFDNSTYPGIVSEALAYTSETKYKTRNVFGREIDEKCGIIPYYVRAHLVKQTNGKYTLYETLSHSDSNYTIEKRTTSKGAVTAAGNSYYAVYAKEDNTLEIFTQQRLTWGYQNKSKIVYFRRSGILCTLPKNFSPDNLKIAAVDDF